MAVMILIKAQFLDNNVTMHYKDVLYIAIYKEMLWILINWSPTGVP